MRQTKRKVAPVDLGELPAPNRPPRKKTRPTIGSADVDDEELK